MSHSDSHLTLLKDAIISEKCMTLSCLGTHKYISSTEVWNNKSNWCYKITKVSLFYQHYKYFISLHFTPEWDSQTSTMEQFRSSSVLLKRVPFNNKLKWKMTFCQSGNLSSWASLGTLSFKWHSSKSVHESIYMHTDIHKYTYI